MNTITQIPTIELRVCTLRPFVMGDKASLAHHINSSHIAERVTNVPSPYTLDHAQAWLEQMRSNKVALREHQKPSRVDFAIEVGGMVVGSVAFIDIKDHMAQVSYWLSREHQGRGIMKVALQAVTNWGIAECGFVRIWGYTWSDNAASQRVLHKAGFALEGIHKKVWAKGGEYYDSHMFAIVV